MTRGIVTLTSYADSSGTALLGKTITLTTIQAGLCRLQDVYFRVWSQDQCRPRIEYNYSYTGFYYASLNVQGT